jgi:hypothetical protein
MRDSHERSWDRRASKAEMNAMPREDQHPEHDEWTEPVVPPGLTDALREAYGTDVGPTPELDARILGAARRHLEPDRHRLTWRRAALPLAAAASLALASGLYLLWPAARLAVPGVAGDLNGDGAVDVLDPFLLARTIRDVGEVDPAWDLNGDGLVDDADVQAAMDLVVAVEGRTL